MKWYLLENSEEQLIVEADKRPDLAPKWTSGTPGYDTREQLFERLQILEKPCVVCGRWAQTHYEDNELMIERNMCFSCNLWTTLIQELPDKPNRLVAEYAPDVVGIYTIVPFDPKDPPYFRGFGGAKFTFQIIATGEVIESTNVWFGGQVPSRFRQQLPPTAVMIKQ